MDLEFVSQNWLLFLALALILALIVLEPLRQKALGIKMIGPLRVSQLVNHESAVVVDVSKSQEYESRHIPGAINFPAADVKEAQTVLAAYEGKPLILTCPSGSRATATALKLAKQGFNDIYVVTGGLAAWEKESLPIDKGKQKNKDATASEAKNKNKKSRAKKTASKKGQTQTKAKPKA